MNLFYTFFSSTRLNCSIHKILHYGIWRGLRERTMYIVISSQFTFIIFANFCVKAFWFWLSCWSLAAKVDVNQCFSGLHRNWNKYFSAMNLPFSEFNNNIYNEILHTLTHSFTPEHNNHYELHMIDIYFTQLTACRFVCSIGAVWILVTNPWHWHAFTSGIPTCKLFRRTNMSFCNIAEREKEKREVTLNKQFHINTVYLFVSMQNICGQTKCVERKHFFLVEFE